jgi:putative phage-type endonuclease
MNNIAEKITFTHKEEWQSYRENRIGGSSIATLLGLNKKYETPYQLWEKMTGKVPPFGGNKNTDRGNMLEPVIAEWISKELDLEIDPRSTGYYVYQHNEHPFIIGSPDREMYKFANPKTNAAFQKVLVEIKSTRMSITPDTVPDSWVVQVNHYMGLSGIHDGVIAWISGNLEFQYIEVRFDQELFDVGINAACDFMMEHVYANIAPDAENGSDSDRAYPAHTNGKIIEATESVLEAVKEIILLKEMVKNQEINLKEKEDRIKILMGDAEAITYMGEKVVTYKYQKGRIMFDSKSFKEAHPDIYKQYEKDSAGYRVLRTYNV